MKKALALVFSALGALLIWSSAGLALADGATPSCSDASKSLVTTSHQITLNGKSISYSTTVGFLEVQVDSGLFAPALNGPNAALAEAPAQPAKGCLFFTYYKVGDASNPSSSPSRPITFAFNGGPGEASLWLHLGALGPRRVDMGPEGLTPALPFQLEDNADSLLDLTDLVFIDPMATGFSFPEDGSKKDEFFGVQNDAMSVATFIRNFLDQFSRRQSPLYIMGESYGGIRGSVVAQLIQNPLYIPLKGLILVSPWLSSTTTNFNEDDNIVPFVTFFPSFATTAWYHAKREGHPAIASRYFAMDDVDSVYEAARKFAYGEYTSALLAGYVLAPDEFHAVAKEMSEFTGIPQEDIEEKGLRLRDVDYFSDILKPEDEVLGHYDARFTGRKLLGQSASNATDPSDMAAGYPIVSAFNQYLRSDLGYQTGATYVDGATITSWPDNSDGTELVATHNLSQALSDNQKLQVFIASGYYDLVCPLGTVEYERDHIDLDSAGAGRVAIHRYPAGHMMYLNPIALHQLKADLSEFYLGAQGPSLAKP